MPRIINLIRSTSSGNYYSFRKCRVRSLRGIPPKAKNCVDDVNFYLAKTEAINITCTINSGVFLDTKMAKRGTSTLVLQQKREFVFCTNLATTDLPKQQVFLTTIRVLF